MNRAKIVIILFILIISIVFNLYFIFQSKRMIVAEALNWGWEGYFEEYDCLGKEVAYCAAIKGHSTCREYYCYGLLINKRCYTQHITETSNKEGKVIREDVNCRFK